jgi:hypothetical protein
VEDLPRGDRGEIIGNTSILLDIDLIVDC